MNHFAVHLILRQHCKPSIKKKRIPGLFWGGKKRGSPSLFEPFRELRNLTTEGVQKVVMLLIIHTDLWKSSI